MALAFSLQAFHLAVVGVRLCRRESCATVGGPRALAKTVEARCEPENMRHHLEVLCLLFLAVLRAVSGYRGGLGCAVVANFGAPVQAKNALRRTDRHESLVATC